MQKIPEVTQNKNNKKHLPFNNSNCSSRNFHKKTSSNKKFPQQYITSTWMYSGTKGHYDSVPPSAVEVAGQRCKALVQREAYSIALNKAKCARKPTSSTPAGH